MTPPYERRAANMELDGAIRSKPDRLRVTNVGVDSQLPERVLHRHLVAQQPHQIGLGRKSVSQLDT
jgi:hypothetical protein